MTKIFNKPPFINTVPKPDKLFITANNYRGKKDIKFSVVRYGNVMGSRGSVIPFFIKKKKTGTLPITDERMTRFNITLQQGIEFVLQCLEKMWGGELFIPKIPSYRLLDIKEAIAPKCKYKVSGIRPGEKLHEEMITESDAMNTIEFDNYYVILPSIKLWDKTKFINESNKSLRLMLFEDLTFDFVLIFSYIPILQ